MNFTHIHSPPIVPPSIHLQHTRTSPCADDLFVLVLTYRTMHIVHPFFTATQISTLHAQNACCMLGLAAVITNS
jgi:hypothetical protein